MNAPDTAIGKRIKCPKCAEAFVVDEPDADEGFEVIEEAVRAKPKRRAVAVVDDDDDEEEEDERPKKKARKGKKKPAAIQPIGLWIGAGVVALLLIGGGLFFATRGGKSGTTSSATSGATEKEIRWVPFTAPDNSFTMAFPEGEPQKETIESIITGNADDIKSAAEFGAWSRTMGDRKYVIIYFTAAGGEALKRVMTSELFANKAVEMWVPGREGPFGGKTNSITKVTVGGIQTVQFAGGNTTKGFVSRVFYLNGRIYLIGVDGEAGMAADDPKATAFMNKFAKGG